MAFRNPHVLWLLFALPFLFAHVLRRERGGSLTLALFPFFPKKTTFRARLALLSRLLPVFALGLLLLALSRPQKGYVEDTFTTEGIDIVLTIDVSSSMKAEDFKPNRLGAAKSVAKEFVLSLIHI